MLSDPLSLKVTFIPAPDDPNSLPELTPIRFNNGTSTPL